MQQELSDAIKIIVEKQATDSPVYTFVKDLKPPTVAAAEMAAAREAAPPSSRAPANNPTISVLMQQAEEALEKNNFIVAKALFADLHAKMPNEISVVHKLALATYKSDLPTRKDALEEAFNLLAGL